MARHSIVTRAVSTAAAAVLLGAGLAVLPSGAAQASSAASHYKLSKATLPNGAKKTLRWNPCTTITYKVNVAAVPSAWRAKALAETKTAFKKLHTATGITFKYSGTTTKVPKTTNLSKLPADITVAFTTPSKTDYDLSGNTLGQGGYQYAWWSKSSGGYGAAIVDGFVVLDTADMAGLKKGFGKGQTQGNVILHELGHVMGLRHVKDSTQQMYPTLKTSAPNGYAVGDRAGLKKVGRKAGCIAVPSSVA